MAQLLVGVGPPSAPVPAEATANAGPGSEPPPMLGPGGCAAAPDCDGSREYGAPPASGRLSGYIVDCRMRSDACSRVDLEAQPQGCC
eukprot:10351904-Alexandrium_andersonii.AAC.1